MCEQVSKQILFSQCAYQAPLFNYESDKSYESSKTLIGYEWRNSSTRFMMDEGTGNSVYVELRCYADYEYILETVVMVNGDVEFEDLQVLERGNQFNHIRKAIETIDELAAIHPANMLLTEKELDEVQA